MADTNISIAAVGKFSRPIENAVKRVGQVKSAVSERGSSLTALAGKLKRVLSVKGLSSRLHDTREALSQAKRATDNVTQSESKAKSKPKPKAIKLVKLHSSALGSGSAQIMAARKELIKLTQAKKSSARLSEQVLKKQRVAIKKANKSTNKLTSSYQKQSQKLSGLQHDIGAASVKLDGLSTAELLLANITAQANKALDQQALKLKQIHRLKDSTQDSAKNSTKNKVEARNTPKGDQFGQTRVPSKSSADITANVNGATGGVTAGGQKPDNKQPGNKQIVGKLAGALVTQWTRDAGAGVAALISERANAAAATVGEWAGADSMLGPLADGVAAAMSQLADDGVGVASEWAGARAGELADTAVSQLASAGDQLRSVLQPDKPSSKPNGKPVVKQSGVNIADIKRVTANNSTNISTNTNTNTSTNTNTNTNTATNAATNTHPGRATNTTTNTARTLDTPSNAGISKLDTSKVGTQLSVGNITADLVTDLASNAGAGVATLISERANAAAAAVGEWAGADSMLGPLADGVAAAMIQLADDGVAVASEWAGARAGELADTAVNKLASAGHLTRSANTTTNTNNNAATNTHIGRTTNTATNTGTNTAKNTAFTSTTNTGTNTTRRLDAPSNADISKLDTSKVGTQSSVGNITADLVTGLASNAGAGVATLISERANAAAAVTEWAGADSMLGPLADGVAAAMSQLADDGVAVASEWVGTQAGELADTAVNNLASAGKRLITGNQTGSGTPTGVVEREKLAKPTLASAIVQTSRSANVASTAIGKLNRKLQALAANAGDYRSRRKRPSKRPKRRPSRRSNLRRPPNQLSANQASANQLSSRQLGPRQLGLHQTSSHQASPNQASLRLSLASVDRRVESNVERLPASGVPRAEVSDNLLPKNMLAKLSDTAGKVFKPLNLVLQSAELASAVAEGDGEQIGAVAGDMAGGLGGAAAGAMMGAAIGSVVPLLGTAVGGLIGSVVGGLSGSAVGEWAGSNLGAWFSEDKTEQAAPSAIAEQSKLLGQVTQSVNFAPVIQITPSGNPAYDRNVSDELMARIKVELSPMLLGNIDVAARADSSLSDRSDT
ncbi:hypothetical protein HQQ94_05455 [Shewanella sp. VB17]|uniref:hypothetical protein n=1 Tax=Shewanella sp. VB17 TaxID=2739432 RepID=UPI001565CF94|nr:hypothetical protein [Shewanella sp. VB17]NRD72703.1 hypothetical protein [Shewanella sp. VB17]